MIRSKVIGGMLLIAGTSIGAGMLGLPIVSAAGGLLYSSGLFIVCWALMTFTALLTLEVSLCFPKGTHLISMINKTLGRLGGVVGWTFYLLFLYALVAAYIAGGKEVVHDIFSMMHVSLPLWFCSIIFTIIFGMLVMSGIRVVDNSNRLLMILKFSVLMILIFMLVPHLDSSYYYLGQLRGLGPAISVSMAAFGFSIIVPSLRNYFEDDVRTVRSVVIGGSLLPLICYLIWDVVIFGTVPLYGSYGLHHLMGSQQPLMGLMHAIYHFTASRFVQWGYRIFTAVCVLTAFTCVSLGLSDYIADGIKRNKQGHSGILIALMTFIPPLLLVLYCPRAFLLALSWGGVLCVGLQALLPSLMAYSARYIKRYDSPYRVKGGRIVLWTSGGISLITIGSLWFI